MNIFRDERGTGMLEFAILTPILLLIYTGIYEFWLLLEIKHKVIQLSRYYCWEMVFRHPITEWGSASEQADIIKEMDREITPFKSLNAKLNTDFQRKDTIDDAFQGLIGGIAGEVVNAIIKGWDLWGLGQIGLGLPFEKDRLVTRVEVEYVPPALYLFTGSKVVLGAADTSYSTTSLIIYPWKAEPPDKDYKKYVWDRVQGVWMAGLLNFDIIHTIVSYLKMIPGLGDLGYLIEGQVNIDKIGSKSQVSKDDTPGY